MDNEIIKKGMKIIDAHFKSEGISRRDALKIFGVGGTASLMTSITTTEIRASVAKGKILIIGGGLSGMATASRLNSSLDDSDITIIEPLDISSSYQPGQTLVAGGIWDIDDIKYNTADFIPDGVTIIKDRAVEFNPDNNSVKLASGDVIKYDFMVVASGLKLDFSKIKGLGVEKSISSLGEHTNVSKTVGQNGITSIYYQQGAKDTWIEMQKFINDAKSGKEVKALFTEPNTPIKCSGTPKEIIYLTDARLRDANSRENAELTFYSHSEKLFEIKDYHNAINSQFKERDFKWNNNHNLIEVDVDKKIATFDKHSNVKGSENKKVEVPFDFLHITPPMVAVEEIANSPIGSSKGWIPVDKETLRHTKYKNIFALGDIADVPMGKTGGSIRKQYVVVVENLIATMEGKEMTAKYDGYTVCPIITSIGTVMLAEFNWASKELGDGVNAVSFPLDPTKERWIWWLLKTYLLKPMTQFGMLSGRA